MKGKRIAFVTSRDYPNLTEDDQVAAKKLCADGVHVVPAVWNEPLIEWDQFDAIVVRSCWDYYRYPEAFRSWITSMQHLAVWNPPGILRWNMDKNYLVELERKGIPIPKTTILKGGDAFDAQALSQQMGTNGVIIKPAVSASAWNTWRCSLAAVSDEEMNRVNSLSGHSDIVVQEFIPEIAKDGEWSIIFFGGMFSHAVRKYPGEGDFRVQKDLGGRYHAVKNPPVHLVQQARSVLKTIEEPLLYARVDGVEREGRLILMELELIEPQLFFDVHPEGAKLFGDQLRRLAFA